MKDDSKVFTEQGSSASHMTAAKVPDVIQTSRMRRTSKWCSIGLHKYKWKTRQSDWDYGNQSTWLSGFVYHDPAKIMGRNSRPCGTASKTSVRTFSGRIGVRTTVCKGLEKKWLGMVMSVHASRKGLLSLCRGGRHKHGNPCGTY